MSTTWKNPPPKNGLGCQPFRSELTSEMDLPATIIPANLRAIECVYVASMLDEARVFDAFDRIVALFAEGRLPLRSSASEKLLYQTWRGGSTRLSSTQRQIIYSRVFSPDAGSARVPQGRRFEDLWLRFVATAGMYAAEFRSLPVSERSVSIDEVRGSGLDLATFLSSHVDRFVSLAAADLKKIVAELLEVLSDHEITLAFEAVDCWQVVQRLWSGERGPRPNVPRSRTRAEAGRIIIRWLANHRNALARPASKLFREEQLREGRTAATPEKKRTYPTDYDLIQACEQWLAMTGTEDAEII